MVTDMQATIMVAIVRTMPRILVPPMNGLVMNGLPMKGLAPRADAFRAIVV
jgi:hypothetical protein